VPFIASNWGEMLSLGILIPFSLVILGWILANNFLGFLLDRLFRKESKIPYIIISALALLLYLDYNNYVQLSGYFRDAFHYVLIHPWMSLVPFLVAIISYLLGFQLIKNNLYIEDLIPVKVTEAKSIQLGFLERYGLAGKLMLLEVKLIMRNKRARMMVFIALVMLAYPMIFLQGEIMEMNWIKLFIGTFVTGMFALNYGQLMLSWNSTHFDLLATRKITMIDIFRAKYYIMAFSCVVLLLPALLYGIIYPEFLWIFPIMFLYNIGITIFIYMFLAAYNSKRIDLSKSAVMNYEGITIAHFLIMVPIIILPIFIRYPFAKMGHPVLGESLIALLGLLGFIFHKTLIVRSTNLFRRNRYKIMAAFRKKN
jgi:hypothetical protein